MVSENHKVSCLLIDTGPLVALINRNDQYHKACLAAAVESRGHFQTAWPVITEACYLLRARPDLVEGLLEIIHEEQIEILSIHAKELTQIGGWMSKFQDQQIDLADACLAYLAEREKISTIFTVDHRHFRLFRATDGKPYTLLPNNIDRP